MMDYLNKSKVPVAVGKRNKFNLNSQHLTTSNFFEFLPAYSRVLPPNSKFKVKQKNFMRCVPLDKPTLGSLSIHNRAFFVPFRFVWNPWNDFITSTPHVGSLTTDFVSRVPTVSLRTIFQYLLLDATSIADQTSEVYDFSYDSDKVVLGINSRRFFKQITSLGYNIPRDYDSKSVDVLFNALPILCIAKVYLDWYFPSAYMNYGIAAGIQSLFQNEDTFSMSVGDLGNIAEVISVVGYSNDFWTGLWDNPVGPNPGVIPSVTVPDVTFGPPFRNNGSSSATNHHIGLSIVQNTNGTPLMVGFQGSQQGVQYSDYPASVMPTQFAIDSLKAVTNMFRRYQLVGARAVDRFLAEYGIQLSNEFLRRSYYIDEYTFPLQIGDVMSNSDTSSDGGASLGAYAGKGIGYGERTFDFDNDDFGLFVIINTIVPDVDYVQGIDRNVMDLMPLDFLHGEFDNLGTTAVSAAEVYPLSATSQGFDVVVNKVFGFAPTYYQYKIPYSRMTGEFALPSRALGLEQWSTVRLFDDSYWPDIPSMRHTLGFVLGNDWQKYNRMFLTALSDSEYAADPFYVIHRFDVELYAHMKPLYDSYDFDESDHNEITFEPNGVKAN